MLSFFNIIIGAASEILAANLTPEGIEAPCSKLQGIFDPQGSNKLFYCTRNKYCYMVIASDRRERGNLAPPERLLRRAAPRNDTIFSAFVLIARSWIHQRKQPFLTIEYYTV
jgi:hypothetical protein